MKYLIFVAFVLIFLMIPVTVISVSIESCRSDSINWLCEWGKTCICTISGSCGNGNILVYEEDVSDILCLPQIISNSATIDWTYCNTTSDYVKIRADCDEGQSSERMIIISGPLTTVLETTTIPETTVIEGICGIDGYCESEVNECVIDYEECPSYNEECYIGEKCCCPVSGITTTVPSEERGFGFVWIVAIIIVIVIVVIYFIFIRGREKEARLTFKRLYEKWMKISGCDRFIRVK